MRGARLVNAVRDGLGDAPGAGIAAVSGGADSVALVLALREAGFSNLTAAHINHQLRGSESEGDEAFVRDLAASLGVAFRSVRIDVAAEAAGENLEAAARTLRYRWLEQVTEEIGAAWVATGHTADDQAETVLHRLIRGAGLRGLRGVARQRPLAGGKLLVRPLLSVSRAEVLDYLKERGQSYRTDSSNADPRFTRNRIRGELMPLIRGFNPEAATALGRLAEQAQESHAFIEKSARELLFRIEKPRAGAMVVLDRAELAAIPRLLARELLRLIWEREGWPMGEMGFEQWERAAALVGGAFPGGVAMHVRERVVQIAESGMINHRGTEDTEKKED